MSNRLDDIAGRLQRFFFKNRSRFYNQMKYMVLETFRQGCRERVYERSREKGRMLPDGLRYIDSWLEKDGDRCFQLMETDSPALFDQWTASWSDLVSFEILELEKREPQN